MGHRTHQFINLLEEIALLKKAPLGIDGSSQKMNNRWKKTISEMRCRNKDIHQYIPFLFLDKYESCNPIRNYKLKLLKNQIYFRCLKPHKISSKLRTWSAKLGIILFCSPTKPIYLQCLNSKSCKDYILLSYASVKTNWVSLKYHYSDLDVTKSNLQEKHRLWFKTVCQNHYL